MAFGSTLLRIVAVHEIGRFNVYGISGVRLTIPQLAQADVVGLVAVGKVINVYVNGGFIGSTNLYTFGPVGGIPAGRFGCGRQDPTLHSVSYGL